MTSNGVQALNQITTSSSGNSRTSLIGSEASSKPLGISLFGSCFQFESQQTKRTYHKTLVILLTFIAYAAFHMGRRPLSVVKNVLNRNCSALPNHTDSDYTTHHMIIGNTLELDNKQDAGNVPSSLSNLVHDNSDCNWAPFDDPATADKLLATLDSSFLLSYALFMFFSGILAERLNLRYFISAGSILSGVGLIAFGLAYPLEIHSMAYFVAIQILTGAVQTTGWPVVVTCVGNWFGPAKRGLIYGFWNSHTSLGNILGAVIAGVFVEYNWGLSFMVPGAIMVVVGLILFFFLVPSPLDVNLHPEANSTAKQSDREGAPLEPTVIAYDLLNKSAESQKSDSSMDKPPSEHKAVSFLTALKIPGVIEYSFCLFFSKLVSYTFLYWLPRYIKSSTSHSSEDSAYLSVPFDVGGVAGGILAGYFSDKFNANGLTCIAMLLTAIPSMFLYQQYGSASNMNNILLQLIVGILVNGPYCLITTAVSADLGTRIKDGRAMATVAAIIDGMGSVGAVLGPLFAGFASNSGNWQAVFIMLMLADVLASLCLIRVTINEIKHKFYNTASLQSL